MTVKYNIAFPAKGYNIIQEALHDLSVYGAEDNLLGGADVGLSKPIPVYRLTLDKITDSASLEKAELTGWKYIIENARGLVGFVDLIGADPDNICFGSLSRNKNAAILVESTHIAQRIITKSNEDCEVRILEIPALYLASIWLTFKKSIFIPYIYPDHSFIGILSVEDNFFEKILWLADAQNHRPGLIKTSPG